MKKLLWTITTIRIKQLYRQLKEIGWIYLLLIAPLIFISFLGLLEFAEKSDWPKIGTATLALLLYIHLKRGDIGLLSKIDLPMALIFSAEYFLALLPFSTLFLILLHSWSDALVLQIGALLIALIPPKGPAEKSGLEDYYGELAEYRSL